MILKWRIFIIFLGKYCRNISADKYLVLLNQSVELARSKTIIEKLQIRLKAKSIEIKNLRRIINNNRKKADRAKTMLQADMKLTDQQANEEINVNAVSIRIFVLHICVGFERQKHIKIGRWVNNLKCD